MPNSKSAAKRIRQNERGNLQNKARKSRVKTVERKFLQLVAAGEAEAAATALASVYSAYDKAEKTNVIHANTVSRKKGRLHAKLRALQAKA